MGKFGIPRVGQGARQLPVTFIKESGFEHKELKPYIIGLASQLQMPSH